MKNNVSRTYLRSVLRSVPCTRKQKAMFTRDLTASVNDYCAGHPEAELSDLTRIFGTPEQIASAWLNDYADSNHFFYQRTKLGAIRLTVAVVIIAAVIICAITIVNYIKRQDFREGHVVDRIVEDATSTDDTQEPIEVH